MPQVMGAVDVKQTSEHELTLEWDSSASNDMIADSALALVTGIDKSPASVKRERPLISPRAFLSHGLRSDYAAPQSLPCPRASPSAC